LRSGHEDVDNGDLCRFNIAGGLSSLSEKAKVSVVKAGASPIREVVAYGQTPAKSGLVVMDGPAMTDFVMTGLMGAGAHLMVNCCGAGIASKMPVVIGADRTSPILPVLKVTGNTRYFRQKENRIDFDAGVLQAHPERLPGRGKQLFELILAVASGKPARTEALQDFFVNFPMRYFQA
jgi:altronate dehydratase large subunit